MLSRIAIALVLLPIGLAWPLPAFAVDDDIFVGILESLSPGRAQELERSYGSTAAADVRVAFAKRAGHWQAFPSDFGDMAELKTASRSFPHKVDWTIAFDGKRRGRVGSELPQQWLAYRDVGVQLIASADKLPRFGKPTAEFEPFDGRAAVYRPLVLVSQPYARDPAQWKPTKLDNGYIERALSDFRLKVTTSDASLTFKDRDVRAVKAYRSNAGEVLFALAIRGVKPPADEVPTSAWSPHWFVANGVDPIRFLGSWLTLIDAGDYDNDGRSEIIFLKADYDFTGYVLFFDGFRQSAEFGWHYH
jgi:hypothetical protein